MQAASQCPGQWQNLHGNVDTSGEWTSNNPGHNLYKQCLPPHPASIPYPGQITTGNYLTQFSCTILQTTSGQVLTSGTQSTTSIKNMTPPQENPFNSKFTGKPNLHIMWNIPSSNCQMFLPVNNMNVQGAINVALDNNGPNMSLCAPRPSSETFNSNNSSLTQQQTTSVSTGPNSSQQFKANRTMDTKSHNVAESNVNTRNLHSRQQHQTNQNLSKSAKKRKSSSTVKYSLPTENAPLRQRSPSGGCIYPCKPASTFYFQQNNAPQKDVAVVTPFPQMASVDASNKSIHNTKVNVLDVRSVQGTVHHYPNIPHPLANTNLNAVGEPNDPTSKHQRPRSGEPRLNDGAKSPVWTDESTSDSNCTSSPKHHSAVTEQKESARSTQIQASETMPNKNCALTDSQRTDKEETDGFSLIPVVEWPLERLHTLVAMVEQIENGHQKNVHKTDPGREILKIYWNGDFCKFHAAVQTGIYQNLMEEVYFYCQKNEPVILRQIRSNNHKAAMDFHILKHNEAPPKMMPYKSSWLNLNEKLDDIDKECGSSRFYRSFHDNPQEKDEHKASNSAHEKPSKLLDASDKLSPSELSQWQAKTMNKVPVEEQRCLELKDTKSDSESLCENMPVSLEPSQHAIDNSSPKPNGVVTEQANCQPNIVNPLKAMTNLVKVLDKQDVPTEISVTPMLDDRFCNDVGSKSPELVELNSQSNQTSSPKLNPVVAEQEFVASSKVQNASSEKMAITDCADTYKSERCDAVPKPRIETVVQEIDKEDRVMERSDTNSGNESICENLSFSCNEQLLPMTDVNCSAKLNSVVAEQSNCQMNTENPLKAITNLMTFDKRDVLQREHQCSTEMSGKSKLDDRFCNDVGVALTDSTSQSNHTSLPKLNPVVAEQQEFCNNEFAVANNNLRSEALPKPSIKLTVQINKEEIEQMTASASNQINVLPHEMAKLCFDGEKMEDKDFQKDSAAPPEIMHKSSSLDTSQVLYTTSAEERISMEKFELNDTQVDNESLRENLPVFFEQLPPMTENCLAKLNGVVTENNNCQLNIVNTLKAINNLVNTLDKNYVSKREHQHSTGTSEKPRLNDWFSNSVKNKSSMLTDESTSQSNCTRATKLNLVVSEQQEFVTSTQIQNGSNDKMPNSDRTVTDKSVRCETVPKPSKEEEIHKMDTSTPFQINVLPHKTAGWCFTGEMMEDTNLEKDSAAPPEIQHKSFSFDTPQVLDTTLAEEPKSIENFELNDTKLDNESLCENLPVSFEQFSVIGSDCSVKLNGVVTEINNSQPNIVNPLKVINNWVNTLDKHDVSKREHQHSTGTSEKPRLNNWISNGVKTSSHMLTDKSTFQSNCTRSTKLSSVVSIQSTLLDVPNKLSSTGYNLYKIIIANNIPVEEQASLELQEKNLDNEHLSGNLPVSLKQSLVAIDNHSPKLNDLVTEQTNSQLNFVNPLMATTNLVGMLEKQYVSLRRHQCQIGKQDVLNRTHQYSTRSSETSRLGDCFGYCAGAKSLDESTSQSDRTSSPKCNPVVGEQHELVTSSQTLNESNEKWSTRNCAGTDNCLRDETEPNPSTGVVVHTKEDSSASLNVLPHEIAKKCFAGEMVEDKDLQTDSAAPPEIQHKSCLLHLHEERNKSFHDTPQIPEQTVNKVLFEEQTYFKLNDTNSENQSLHENLPTSFKQSLPVTGDNRLPKLNGVVTDLTNCQLNFVNPLEAMTNMVKKMEKRKVSIRKRLHQFKNEQDFLKKYQYSIRSSEMSRLDDRFSNCAGAKSLVLTESTSQSDCTSLPKCNPIVAEQLEFVPLSQIQNEPNENMPHDDCSETDESVICETESEPSAVAVAALASVQINVLPHKMAEQWFGGEMEDQGLQNDNAGEDQLKVHVLDLRSDIEVLIEDFKIKESNNQSAVDDELESYCCLAKWFQTLQYGDGSSCKCQEKAELNEKGTKIEAHATHLEVPRTKDDYSNAFSNECGHTELEIGSPERRVENASESTEAKNPLMSHTNVADVDKIKILKENSSSEEVFEVERVTSEHSRYKSLSKCATNETLKCCEMEKDTPDPDSKRQKTKSVCLSLYGSSSDGNNKVIPTKIYQVKESCQEPLETLRVTLSSHQKNEEKRTSNKRKWFESLNNEDGLETRRKRMSGSFATFDLSGISPPHEVTQTRVSKVTKENANALSSPSVRKLVSPSLNSKSKVRKGKLNNRTQQISMNTFIVRGKTMPSKSSLQSPLTVMQSKYEMGNPALMPLEEGLWLEFKVLPKSFNFMEGTELNSGQADKSPNAKNEIPHPEDKRAKRTKTSHAPAQDAWRFSPWKTKHTGSNQATDISDSGSLFQEFKKRFLDKKRGNVSHQNLNSN